MPVIPRSLLDGLTAELNVVSESRQEMVERAVSRAAARLAGPDGLVAEPDVAALRAVAVEAMEIACSEASDVAAARAAEFYDAVREISVGEAGESLAESGRDPEATERAVRGMAGSVARTGDARPFVDALKARVDYEVKRAAGECVYLNGARDRSDVRFARVPAGIETCGFCLMLASRGFVYHSRERAGSDGHYHANCDCRIVPGFDGMEVEGYDPVGLYERYRDCENALDEGWLQKTYAKLPDDARASKSFDEYRVNQVLAEMRTRDPQWLNKGVRPAVEYQSDRAEHEFSAYEKTLALILSDHGFASLVLERSNAPGVKTPDVMLNETRCDFKRPKGNKFNTIDGLVRDAGKKADTIVFYLEPGVSTATKEQVVSYFEQCGLRRGIRSALIVDYDKRLTRIKL